MAVKTDAQLRTESTNEILGKTYAPSRADTFNQDMIDSKANNDSPVLTGNPTTPNQAFGDSSGKIANTLFVQTALSGGVSAGSKLYVFNNFT